MELVFSRNGDDNEIHVKIKEEGKEFDFDYIKFIEYIYNNPEKDINTEFKDDIEGSQMKLIRTMMEDIYKIMRNSDK